MTRNVVDKMGQTATWLHLAIVALGVMATLVLALITYSDRLTRVETQMQEARVSDLADRLDRLESRTSAIETNVTWIRETLERRSAHQ